MDSLLWLVSLSADTRELQGPEQLWLTETLRAEVDQTHQMGSYWFCLVSCADRHTTAAKSSFLSFSYSISEE